MPSCLPDLVPQRISHSFSLAFQLFPSCLPDVVSQLSPRCLPGAVAKMLPSRFLHLLVSRPVVAKMWSPNCLPHVVSQVLSPSCFQRTSYVSQFGWWCPALRMSSPSCPQGFPIASIASTLVVWFSTRLPDVVSQLSPRCLPGAVAKMLSPSCLQGFYTCCLVFHLSPRCGLPDVVSPVVS